jgi:diaminopimelate epimerase
MTAPLSDGPITKIAFTKASACGNDFLLVYGVEASSDLAALTRRMCDRHYGVGADGVEWLFPDAEAEVSARLINADGSEAEISGNGTRCVAAEIYSRTGKTEIAIRTGAGLKICRVVDLHSDKGVKPHKIQPSNTFEFETDMGEPEVGAELPIETKFVHVKGTRISMGNPHFVIFVEEFQDGWRKQAELIGAQPQFPQGTNVEYVVVNSRNEINIRIFERGAGETQSSGTGSCASAVAAIASGRAASPVTVIAPGGPQTVRWEKQVYLRGPATLICHGEFFV